MQTKPKANSVVTSAFDPAAQTLTFRVLGAGEATLDFKRVSPAVMERFRVQGANQRCANAAALEHDKTSGLAATPEQKFAGVKKLVDHYNTGTDEYSPARAETTIGLDPLLLAALAEAIGKDVPAARAMVEKKAEAHKVTQRAYLARMAQSEKVAPIVTRMRAAEASDIDPDAEIDEAVDEE